MRRLTAQKEIVTNDIESLNTSTMQFTWQFGDAFGNPTLFINPFEIIRFEYNRQTYSVICYRPVADELNADFLNSLGVPLDVIPIFVPTRLIVSTRYYPVSFAQEIANITGAVIMIDANDVNIGKRIVKVRASFPESDAFVVTYQDAAVTGVTIANAAFNWQTTTETLGEIIDLTIGEDTAIGVTLQAYDLKEPSKVRLSVSNNFTLPKTVENIKFHGIGETLQETNTNIYDAWRVKYYIDNTLIVDNGRVMVESVTNDKLNCILFDKGTAWDKMKDTAWSDFMEGYYDWLLANHAGTLYFLTFAEAVQALRNRTEHSYLPAFYGDLFLKKLLNAQPVIEEGQNLSVRYEGINGGHICTYIKSIFQYITERFDIDFFPSQSNLLWDNATLGKSFIQNRYLTIKEEVDGFYIRFAPKVFQDVQHYVADKSQRNVLDFVTTTIQQLGCILDKVGDNQYAIRLFDEIPTEADEVDWSGLIDKEYVFTPFVKDMAQNNYIDFSSYSENVVAGSLKKNIVTQNRNTQFEKELFKINAFVPSFYRVVDSVMIALNEAKSLEDFTLMVASGETQSFNVSWSDGVNSYSGTYTLPIAAFIGLDSSYNFYQTLMSYPKVFKLKKWLDITMVEDLQFFRKYFIKELGGVFYLNAVNGFNPDGSKQATEIELIHIPD